MAVVALDIHFFLKLHIFSLSNLQCFSFKWYDLSHMKFQMRVSFLLLLLHCLLFERQSISPPSLFLFIYFFSTYYLSLFLVIALLSYS